ncbi:MAG: hypothetical protein DDT19_02908 [Syntrophomonadaceae bacterium]|nr:hypothetical protein [Bacillota bacterium]
MLIQTLRIGHCRQFPGPQIFSPIRCNYQLEKIERDFTGAAHHFQGLLVKCGLMQQIYPPVYGGIILAAVGWTAQVIPFVLTVSVLPGGNTHTFLVDCLNIGFCMTIQTPLPGSFCLKPPDITARLLRFLVLLWISHRLQGCSPVVYQK